MTEQTRRGLSDTPSGHQEKQAMHTPGPWASHPLVARIVPFAHLTRPIGAADDAAVDLQKYAQEICALQWPDRHRSEAEMRANGQLIATAPDLLEVLEYELAALAEDIRWCDDSDLERLTQRRDLMEEVIKKARTHD